MYKPIKIMNQEQLYEVGIKDVFYICTIENVGRDEYHAYCDEGEGFSVAQLDSIDIIELISTGALHRENLTIHIK